MARRSKRAVVEQLLAFACSLPDTDEDHPWGDTVVKTNGKKKIFVFLGSQDLDEASSVTVKLVDSHEQALQCDGAEPSGYGLGRAGWVTIPLGAGAPPVAVLEDWVEESYRQVALKRNVKALDELAG